MKNLRHNSLRSNVIDTFEKCYDPVYIIKREILGQKIKVEKTIKINVFKHSNVLIIILI